MLSDRLETKWIDAFAEVFELCRVGSGDPVAILAETQSRQLNVHLAELGLARLSARPFHVVIPSPPHEGPLPFRGSGTTDLIRDLRPVVSAMTSAAMVVDCSQESILYAVELREILDAGTRLLRISDEHPEILERLKPHTEDEQKTKLAKNMLDAAKTMRVVSDAGTDLVVDVSGVEAEGIWGYCDQPGQMSHWPGGMVLCFPKAASVDGTIVVDSGDLNLTFKRYMETAVTLRFEQDYITEIEGDGADADLFRSYIAATGDQEAYAMSHVGWGLNGRARWDALTIYDRGDVNGTEQRVSAGNFLFSTGGNWAAERHTRGHFDIPLRACTISLDNKIVVERGILAGELA